MIVKELREFLQKCNDEDKVVLSIDSEGNQYKDLVEICDEIYIDDENEIHFPFDECDEDILCEFDSKEDYEDFLSERYKCIVLYPR